MRSAISTAFVTALAIAVLEPGQALGAERQIVPAVEVIGRAQTVNLLAWYDTLGFPDTAGRPCVRVTTGMWRQAGDGPREIQFAEGFLLDEDATSFTVFISGLGTLGRAGFSAGLDSPWAPLNVVRFIRKADGPEYERVGYRRIGLSAVARDVLERVRRFAADAESIDRMWFDIGSPPSQRAQIFLFARAALQNGLLDEAAELFDVIEEQLPFEMNDRDLLRELQRNIGATVLARMETDALDPSYSRDAMLQAYASFEKRFPASDKGPYTRAAAESLRRMIAEGRARPARRIDSLTPPEQAAEWIYQLRDLKVPMSYWFSGQRYPMDPATPRDESEKTPVHHLVDLGNAAVPALLDALADESFTRTHVSICCKVGPPQAMRVSDFARGILEFMAGRTFGGPPAGNAAARPAAEAWWAELQGKGARQQLMDDTAAGGMAGMQAARKLVQLHPDAAIGPLEQALSTAPSKGTRAAFVDIAATIPGDSALPLLRAQLVPQAGLPAQIRAARALLVRGHRDVVPIMIQAWRDLQPRLREPLPPTAPLMPNGAGGYETDDPLFDVAELIAFLAESGEPRAIDALAEEIPKAAVDVRLGVVSVFLPRAGSMVLSASGRVVRVVRWPPGLAAPAAADVPPGAVDAAVERLLLAALRDTAPRLQMQFQYNGKVLSDPRICDIAALALAARQPDRHAFDLSADTRARNAAISLIISQ